jgi:hypothetical protein
MDNVELEALPNSKLIPVAETEPLPIGILVKF